MVDQKLTALTEETVPLGTDILYIVDDPGGTPLSKKVQITNLPGDAVVGTHHISINASAMYPGITTPCDAIAQREVGANNQQVKYLNFPGEANGDTVAFFDWFPPQNWDTLTVKLKLYWTTELPSVTGDDYRIVVSAVARSNTEAIGGAAFGSVVNIDDTFLAVDQLHISPQSGSITVGQTPADFDWIQFKLLRDVSIVTANEGPFQLMGAVLEYTIDAALSVG